MKKPSLINNVLTMPVNRSGGNWSLFYQPALYEAPEKVTLFDNDAGEEHIVVTDEDYAERKQQVLDNEGASAANDWVLNSPYCTAGFARVCLEVAFMDELLHMRAVWQALNLLAKIG